MDPNLDPCGSDLQTTAAQYVGASRCLANFSNRHLLSAILLATLAAEGVNSPILTYADYTSAVVVDETTILTPLLAMPIRHWSLVAETTTDVLVTMTHEDATINTQLVAAGSTLNFSLSEGQSGIASWTIGTLGAGGKITINYKN